MNSLVIAQETTLPGIGGNLSGSFQESIFANYIRIISKL
jgi:hypothetical protein